MIELHLSVTVRYCVNCVEKTKVSIEINSSVLINITLIFGT